MLGAALWLSPIDRLRCLGCAVAQTWANDVRIVRCVMHRVCAVCLELLMWGAQRQRSACLVCAPQVLRPRCHGEQGTGIVFCGLKTSVLFFPDWAQVAGLAGPSHAARVHLVQLHHSYGHS